MHFLKDKKGVMKFSLIIFSFVFIFILSTSGEVSAIPCEEGTNKTCGGGVCAGIQICVNGSWGVCSSSGNECLRTKYCVEGCDGYANVTTCDAEGFCSVNSINYSDESGCQGYVCGDCMDEDAETY